MRSVLYTRKVANVLWRGQTISYRNIKTSFLKVRSPLKTVITSTVTPPSPQCISHISLQGNVIFKSTSSIGF